MKNQRIDERNIFISYTSRSKLLQYTGNHFTKGVCLHTIPIFIKISVQLILLSHVITHKQINRKKKIKVQPRRRK